VDPAWVKPSIVLMTLWGVAGTMVIFLAALKNVPRELYEVASLDGAGTVRQFFTITIPMISSAIFFNVIVLTIAALQVFDQAFLLFLASSEQRLAGVVAVLRRLPVPAGVPAVRLRLRLRDCLAAVRHHHDRHRSPGAAREPVPLLRAFDRDGAKT
jgi:Binding-protein-dependent transport system inner membrane component